MDFSPAPGTGAPWGTSPPSIHSGSCPAMRSWAGLPRCGTCPRCNRLEKILGITDNVGLDVGLYVGNQFRRFGRVAVHEAAVAAWVAWNEYDAEEKKRVGI